MVIVSSHIKVSGLQKSHTMYCYCKYLYAYTKVKLLAVCVVVCMYAYFWMLLSNQIF